MKNYRWGILGPGKIANKFATALTLAGNATLDAVASRDEGRAREFAATHKAARAYGNYTALADDPDIDAVYIASPHGYHAEHAILCLRKRKAVLCEKPMALSAREVQDMIDASRSNGAFLMEAMWSRFLPMTESILRLIHDGRIGAVRYVNANFGFAAPANPEGRLYNLRLGGGALLDVGVYPLFLCLQLLGEPDTIRAAGRLASTGADETTHAILQYHDGRSAVMSCSIACQTSVTAEIAGTEGTILIPGPWYKNDRFTLRRTGGEPELITVEPMVNGFEYEIREVADCLGQGLVESPRMPHAFSLMLSRVMDAIRAQIGMRYPGE
jgi:predicted dehydrogenase